MITLQNRNLALVVSEKGAEIQSLKTKSTGTEYIWNGNPTWWPRHAPILFPLSGPTKDGKIAVGGKEYTMPNNGFARDETWTLAGKSDTSATFVLEDSDDSRQYYPYGFRLTTSYTLHSDRITIRTLIESKSDGMRCVYALHPAFMLSINRDATLDTYLVSFSGPEDQSIDSLQNKVFFPEEERLKGSVLHLSQQQLDKGPVVLHAVRSSSVRLLSTKGNHGVEISMGDLHTLVCWSPEKKKAPFVCVEPMYSFGDSTRPLDLEKMPGLFTLKKGQKKAFTNTIRPF